MDIASQVTLLLNRMKKFQSLIYMADVMIDYATCRKDRL